MVSIGSVVSTPNGLIHSMSSTLGVEIRKHAQICRLLRSNFRDTKAVLKELASSGHFDSELIGSIGISRAEEAAINSSIDKVPTIVILGGDHGSKLNLVNMLLGQSVLPVILDEPSEGWRMLRLVYGVNKSVSLSVQGNFELVDPILSGTHNHATVEELMMVPEGNDLAVNNAILEMCLSNEVLMSGWRIIVQPTPCQGETEVAFKKYAENTLPIFIYVLPGISISEKERNAVFEHRQWSPHFPVLYYCPDAPTPNSDSNPDVVPNPRTSVVLQQLHELGCLVLPTHDKRDLDEKANAAVMNSELICGPALLPTVTSFAHKVLSARLLEAGSCLYEIHERILTNFTTYAFDIARDIMITPRRLEYVRSKELELYEQLCSIANRKQDEIELIIQETVDNIREPLCEEAEAYVFQGVDLSDDSDGSARSAKYLEVCTEEIRELVLSKVNSAVAGKLIGSVNCLRESFIGTLCRCLEALEISKEGTQSTYPSAGSALKQIFNAAYQVHLNAASSSSFSQIFYEKLRMVFHSLRWSATDSFDSTWKRNVAVEMVESLSPPKLAKNICSQFRDRLKHAHDIFLLSIRQLECKHADRLEKMEQKRGKVRKLHAPKVSKLALESASTRDLIRYGMPRVGREIGRGQYGVVYSCESWAGNAPCAVKSVVPPDDKHWNDLAMECYYTRSVPKHPRVVSLYGTIIDYSYGDGSASMGPAVLFVMERLPRDLHAALKVGLAWGFRLQIALDVIEGIRYLHSQGLVHRDVKLKNVLLDKNNRAKLTDLGFCKPEAMLSGSIVGTPIHMAPEIFTGHRYDHSVDIYAFGILFWFLCSGSIRLPQVFEPSMSKDMLKTSVRKGIRPERLAQFDEQCWSLMSACWSTEPHLRPLPGDIEPRLKEIYQNYKRGCPANHIIKETEVTVGSIAGSPFIDLNITNR